MRNSKIAYFVFSLVLITVMVVSSRARAEVFFDLTFDKQSLFVSSYIEPDNRLSLAISPTSFPTLSNRSQMKTKPSGSSFDSKSIRFRTEYYRRGKEPYYLVPVSVDAVAYSDWRRTEQYRQAFRETLVKSFTDRTNKKRSSGLGINVALPKRLQKIFGEGEAGLKVSGYRKIMFSGRSQWTDNEQSDLYQQSRFPTLKMDQISRFDITGTIGTKITVKVSQDSQVDIPLENRIQIRYRGDDDDILKTIEAGNTTLSLPNKEFVGYSSQIRGLFGLKAEAQVGNLSLVGIMSQEKGSTEKTSLSASGVENADYTRDYEYEQRRIFDLVLPHELQTGDSVMEVIMFESTNPNQTELDANFANFYVDPNDTSLYSSEKNANGGARAKIINFDQYELFTFPDSNIHYVYFKSNRSTQYYLGFWMKYLDGSTGQEVTIGNIEKDTMDLKLLYPARDQERPTNVTWNQMWRNLYRVTRGVNINDLDLKILKGRNGTEGSVGNKDYQESENNSPFIEILGLDQYNSQNQKLPDNYIDERQAIYRPDWGLIIFPEREPFNSSRVFVHADNSISDSLIDKVPTIYRYETEKDRLEDSEYYLQVSTKTRSSIIKLSRVNIIEGSEQVTVNGSPLTKGTDYNIDYEFGQVTLMSDKAMDPNGDLKIDFEYAPFFAVQKKTLFGFRADYEWSKDLKFGTTVLYKSDKAQDRKPKVGQETAKMVVFDADMQLKLHPNFLTSVVDALPLVETEAKSNLSISGEVAQSHPNPNVNDIAYIDDFETSSEILSLGIFRSDWHKATFPAQLNRAEYVNGKMRWYSPHDAPAISAIYDRDTETGAGTARILRMDFRPQPYRIDTLDFNADSCLLIDADTLPAPTFSGVMRYFGNRVDAAKAKLLEIRLNKNKLTSGKLHFEFGLINEDLNGDGAADNEDNEDFNDIVSESEDVGLDNKADIEELCYDPIDNPDPAGDNYWFRGVGVPPLPKSIMDTVDWEDENHPLYYEFINGTEGNLNDQLTSSRPDVEALSPSKNFNTTDAYFSYELDFDDPGMYDDFFVPGSDTVNNDTSSWGTFRIPIRDTVNLTNYETVATGSAVPSWNQITYIRVWYEHPPMSTDTQTLEIAHWGFVQSNWRDTAIIVDPVTSMTEFVVATVSDEDNTYSAHPDIEPYEDPNTKVIEPQRALELKFDNLDHRDSVFVTKELITVDSYSGYSKLQMYVHANLSDEDRNKIQFYFRLGENEQNWYEFYTPLDTGWSEQNFLNIDFEELTALKDSALRSLSVGQQLDTVVSGDRYRFFGRPNINQIRFFTIGVVNTDSARAISGDIWLDEMRVTDVRKDVGTAGRVSVSGNLADLLTYNFSLRSKDPYFRGISAATRGGSNNNLGSGRQETQFNYGVTLNLDKILPRSWGARLPVSFSYAKTTLTPLLKTNSDIILPEESRLLEQTVSESKSVSVSANFKKKGRNPLFSVLLNRIKTRFSYRRNLSRNPNTPYSFGENYDVSVDYDLSIKKVPRIPIFFWTKYIPLLKKTSQNKLSLYPESWTTTARYSRNLTVSDDINFNRRSTIKRDFFGSTRLSYRLLDNLTSSFSYETRRDLSNLDDVNLVFDLNKFKLGLEKYYAQRFNASYDPKMFTFFTTKFAYSANYTENYEPSNTSKRSSLARSYSVSGVFDHKALLGGKPSGRRGIPQRRTRGRGSRTTAEREAEKEKEANKTHFYEYPVKALKFLTSWVDPFSYSHSRSFNNSVPGMITRPSLKYRFGLMDNPEVERTSDTRSQSSDQGRAYELGSGFTFLGGVVTTIKFKQAISEDVFRVGRGRQRNISTSWPDMTIRISKFKNLPLIQTYVNKFITVFSPRTGFSRSVKKSENIDGGYTLNETESRSYNPLLSINFKLFRSMSLSSSYNTSNDKRKVFNQLSGVQESTTSTNRSALSLTASYSFSSPHGISIPLFGKLKFQSQVDISMNLKISKQKSVTEKPNAAEAVSDDKSDFAVAPNIAYTFSRQIRGGITLRWQDTNDNYRNRKSHVREVQLWTEIRF